MRLTTIVAIFGLGFILFKIAGVGSVKDWSWWLVLSPFLGLSIVFALLVIVGISKELWEQRDENRSSFTDGKPEGWLAEKLRGRRERKAAKWASE